MNNNTERTYSEEFKVHTYEVDLHNRLTIQSLCQFLQEAASNHADTLGFGVEYLLKNKRTWVLSRLTVKIEEPVALGDTITIKTWPSGTEKFFFIRDFLIESSSGKIIGNAASYWIFLDTEKMRPVHPSKGEIVFNFGELPKSFEHSPDKLPALENPESSLSFHVRYSDLDLNNHVNNITYIEWVMEGIDHNYRRTNIPVSLEINFLSEAKYGDTVELSKEDIGAGQFMHSLLNGNTEICRAKTIWMTV